MACLHTSADRGSQFSQKFTYARYLTALCTNCVGGGGSRYGAHFEGHAQVLSKTLSSPTPKFGGGPLIFECQIVRPPNPYKTQKVRGRNVPPFLLYKSSKMSPFFHKIRLFSTTCAADVLQFKTIIPWSSTV